MPDDPNSINWPDPNAPRIQIPAGVKTVMSPGIRVFDTAPSFFDVPRSSRPNFIWIPPPKGYMDDLGLDAVSATWYDKDLYPNIPAGSYPIYNEQGLQQWTIPDYFRNPYE